MGFRSRRNFLKNDLGQVEVDEKFYFDKPKNIIQENGDGNEQPAFETVFNEWDQDKDGKVNNNEMMDVWKKMAGDKFQDNEAQVFFLHDP